MRYTFSRAHTRSCPVRRVCWLFDVHPSGYYAWRKQPRSCRARVNQRLTGLIKQFWLECGGVYGYRQIHTDLRDVGERCGENRVYRLMRAAGLHARVGYGRPRQRSGPASVHAPNRVQQQFSVAKPNEVWVSDITHVRTHEGWLYLAVILDLFSRRVIGGSLQARIKQERVWDALLMAVWRTKPTSTVTVHTDQGSQYTRHDWQNFLKAHNLEASLSRRGNCCDNALAKSFFQWLKRERIKRHIYSTRDDARSDIVDYIEMFYNSK